MQDLDQNPGCPVAKATSKAVTAPKYICGLTQGSPHLGTTDPLGWAITVGGHPVHCRVFSGIPGLYLVPVIAPS